MAFERKDMLFNDGSYYKWKAKADDDNPNFRGGTDHAELNKTEGYEVIDFINRYAEKWTWTTDGKQHGPTVAIYQKMERMIKAAPPKSTHKEVAEFILNNWKKH